VPQDNMLPGSAFDDARAFSLRSLRSFSITTTTDLIKVDQQFIPALYVPL
jgi:hypothetical protein